MRILILSANTGGGHNSAAVALVEQFRAQGIECEISDALSFVSKRFSDFISRGHSYVYRNLPHLFGLGYRFEEKHPNNFIYDQCAKGADRLFEKLKRGYDAVISVHVFAGMMMTAVQKRYGVSAPSYFVATDYTCSPGVGEILAEGYFVAHRSLVREFLQAGIDASRIHATGIPVAQAFYRLPTQEAARHALGLPRGGQMVLVSGGSMGAGKMTRSSMRLLSRLPQDCHLCVLCGRNDRARRALGACVDPRLHAIGFTDQMPLYLAAADLYVTKAGGLSTTEAMVSRLPMIVVHAVPGCESRNFEFLVHRGVACGAQRWRQAVLLSLRALRTPAILEHDAREMAELIPQNAARLICERVLSDVQSLKKP